MCFGGVAFCVRPSQRRCSHTAFRPKFDLDLDIDIEIEIEIELPHKRTLR
jgi:hypothetical protein